MPYSNPGLLPQKSGALPMSHHISKATTAPSPDKIVLYMHWSAWCQIKFGYSGGDQDTRWHSPRFKKNQYTPVGWSDRLLFLRFRKWVHAVVSIKCNFRILIPNLAWYACSTRTSKLFIFFNRRDLKNYFIFDTNLPFRSKNICKQFWN